VAQEESGNDGPCTWDQHGRSVEQLTERFAAATDLLAEAGPDLPAFTAFPKQHWREIWSNNPLERLSKEICRRTDVVGIFAARASSAWSGRSWPSSTRSGRWPAAT